MTKRPNRRMDLLEAAAQMAISNKKFADINYIEGLLAMIIVELRALGITEKEFDAAAAGELPRNSRIKKLIEDFEPDNTSWITERALSVDAYERRLRLFRFILALQEAGEEEMEIGNFMTPDDSKIDPEISKLIPEKWMRGPEFWMNTGALIAWWAYSADREYIDGNNKAEFGAIGGRGRAGKIFSPAKIAISHALSVGCKSAKEVATYFETEPVIDEHDIEVYCERDESGEPESFSFMNLSNGIMSRPMKSTTLPAAISQVKAHLAN